MYAVNSADVCVVMGLAANIVTGDCLHTLFAMEIHPKLSKEYRLSKIHFIPRLVYRHFN